MQITIEKNVPLSRPNNGKYAAAAAAMKTMAVGDSFMFPAEGMPSPLYGLGKEAGIKVAVREIGQGQYRVWRKA